MGAGIALEIKKRYPSNFQEYVDYIKGFKSNTEALGTCLVSSSIVETRIANIFGQIDYRNKGRNLNYEALYSGLESLCGQAVSSTVSKKSHLLGIPYKMGAGLSGGSWGVIESMLIDIFGLRFPDKFTDVLICVHPDHKHEMSFVRP